MTRWSAGVLALVWAGMAWSGTEPPPVGKPVMPGTGYHQAVSAPTTVPSAPAAAPAPLPPGSGDGKQVYTSYCALCHGADGQGNGPLAVKLGMGTVVPNLTAHMYQGLDPAKMLESIKGHGVRKLQMPQWSRILADNDLVAVVAYVKKLSQHAQVMNGRRIFTSYCSRCHGGYGKGDGPLAKMLNISDKLPNLDDAKYKEMEPGKLFGLVKRYQMNFFTNEAKVNEVISESDLADVVAFLRHISDRNFDVVGNADVGREIFRHHCTACHGPEGKGDGPMIKLMNIKMVDYTTQSQQGMSDYELVHFIGMGKGQFMPAWFGTLTMNEVRDVAAYVRTLYRP